LPELKGYFPVEGTVNYLLMAVIGSKMDTAKLFKHSLSSSLAEIYSHFTLRLIEWPRPPCVYRDFDKLRLDFPEVGGYFPVPGTVN